MLTGCRESMLQYLGDPAQPACWGWRLYVDQDRGLYYRMFADGTPLWASPIEIAAVCFHEPEMALEVSPPEDDL